MRTSLLNFNRAHNTFKRGFTSRSVEGFTGAVGNTPLVCGRFLLYFWDSRWELGDSFSVVALGLARSDRNSYRVYRTYGWVVGHGVPVFFFGGST